MHPRYSTCKHTDRIKDLNIIFMVFDEATSALDGVTEDAVLQAMNNAAEQKTLIVIAHRLTTVKSCSRIYLLEKGRIVAEGTYDELMQSNEKFQKMAKVGTGTNITGSSN